MRPTRSFLSLITSEPDGGTLLLTDCINHLLAPSFNASLSYDPLKDFAPVASIAQGDWVMVTDRATPVSTVAEFIAYAKAHPGTLNFGYGLATSPQVVGAFLTQAAGLDLVNVPYKSGSEAVADMLGGRINLNFGTAAVLKPLIAAGQLKALAVTRRTRSPDLPDVPTMIEAGLPDLTLSFSVGVFAPAATPPAIVARLHDGVTQAVASAPVRDALLRLGFEPQALSAAMFAQTLRDQGAKWIPAAKRLGVKI